MTAKKSLDEYLANVRPEGNCLIWLGSLNNSGYGPHRKLYELSYGPLPSGMELDHLCRRRSCVNLAHLEVVTKSENSKRGAGPRLLVQHNLAKFAAITHCPHGHEYSASNTILVKTKANGLARRCRECSLARMRVYGKAYYQRKKMA